MQLCLGCFCIKYNPHLQNMEVVWQEDLDLARTPVKLCGSSLT